MHDEPEGAGGVGLTCVVGDEGAEGGSEREGGGQVDGVEAPDGGRWQPSRGDEDVGSGGKGDDIARSGPQGEPAQLGNPLCRLGVTVAQDGSGDFGNGDLAGDEFGACVRKPRVEGFRLRLRCVRRAISTPSRVTMSPRGASASCSKTAEGAWLSPAPLPRYFVEVAVLLLVVLTDDTSRVGAM